MKVLARVSPVLMRTAEDCIMVRKMLSHPSQRDEHRAGTVILRNVRVTDALKGELVEESPNAVRPRGSVLAWARLRFSPDRGSYVDMLTGDTVQRAKAVYMAGTKVWYLPA